MRFGGNFGRFLLAVGCGWCLAAVAWANPSQDLDRAIELYEAGQYTEAQQLLLEIDRDALPNDEKKQRDELVEDVRQAINQLNRATQNLQDAEAAYEQSDLNAAERFYQAVLDNEFASDEQRTQAREGLARLEEKRALNAQLAAQAPEDGTQAQATQPVTETTVEIQVETTQTPADEARPTRRAPVDPTQRAQARAERNRVLAGDAIEAGNDALQHGRYDSAQRKFQQALKLIPDSAEARHGLELVREHRQAEGQGDLLSESVNRRRGRWMRTETLYREKEQEVRRLINQHEYPSARERLHMAMQLLDAARRDAEPADRYTFLKRQAEALARFIEAEQEAYEEEQSAVQRREALIKERERQDAVRRDKSERIAQLMNQFMQFQKERQYTKAADILREVLAIDPGYQNAEFLLRVIEDTAIAREQMDHHRTFLNQMQESFFEAEKTRGTSGLGVKGRFVAYPDEDAWRVIANRDPFGGDLSGEDEIDRETRRRLDSTIPSFEFPEGTGFSDVIDFLRTETGLNIIPNWNALAIFGIDQTTDVGDIQLTNVPVERALSELLSNVGGADAPLDYDVVDGVVRISTQDQLALAQAAERESKVYDVRDLLVKKRGFSAPTEDSFGGGMGGMGGFGGGGGGFGGGGFGGGGFGGGGGGFGGGGSSFGGSGSRGDDDDDSSEEAREELEDEFIELIKTSVGTGTWESDGGEGTVDLWNSRLIVRQTPAVHREIVEFLSDLRQFKDIQVAIEARFVTLRSNFLEEIGVDLDVALNTANAGYDQAYSGGTPIIDPYTGQYLLQPRRFTELGLAPTAYVPGGQPLAQQVALDQPFQNVALVPQGNPGNWLSRHTTPVPMVNNTLGMAGPRSTNVPGNLTDLFRSSGPAFSIFGSFLDNIQVDFLLRATQLDSRGSSVDAPRLVCPAGLSGYIQVNTMVSYVATPGFAPAGGAGVGGQAALGQNPVPSMLPAGRTLTVLPTVSGDRKYVTMELRPRVTNVSFQTIPVQQGALASFFQVPQFEITEIRTTVTVPDGGTLLLGGLKLAAEEEIEAGVPVVSKIPILKRAFTNRSRTKDEYVLLILVKPTILIQDEQENEAFPDLVTSDSDAIGI